MCRSLQCCFSASLQLCQGRVSIPTGSAAACRRGSASSGGGTPVVRPAGPGLKPRCGTSGDPFARDGARAAKRGRARARPMHPLGKGEAGALFGLRRVRDRAAGVLLIYHRTALFWVGLWSDCARIARNHRRQSGSSVHIRPLHDHRRHAHGGVSSGGRVRTQRQLSTPQRRARAARLRCVVRPHDSPGGNPEARFGSSPRMI